VRLDRRTIQRGVEPIKARECEFGNVLEEGGRWRWFSESGKGEAEGPELWLKETKEEKGMR